MRVRKKTTFTFRTERPVGKDRSFEPVKYVIKFKLKDCGYFYEKCGSVSSIHLIIYKDKNHDDRDKSREWIDVILNDKFETVEKTKKFLVYNTDKIRREVNLYLE
jgi:hypothetical protein